MTKLFKLKNGINCVLNHKRCYKTCTIVVLFKVGSRNEPKGYHGIAHFIEHMMFKGSITNPSSREISTQITKYGGKINAFTSYDTTGYYITINSKYLEKALQILTSMLYESCFRQNDIRDEKLIVINENNTRNSDPKQRINEISMSTTFRGTNLEHSIGGDNSQIRKYSTFKIFSFLKKYYKNKNMVISIAGKIPNNINILLNNYFGNKKFKYNGKNINGVNKIYKNFWKKQKHKQITHVSSNLQHAFINISFSVFSLLDDNLLIMDLIGVILAGNMNSRLFTKLRECNGLVYNVKYHLESFIDTGIFNISCSTNNNVKNILKTIFIIINEFNCLKLGIITNTELDDAKQYLIGNMIMNLEDNRIMAKSYANDLLMTKKIKSISSIKNKILKINISNISHISQLIFNKQKCNISVLGVKS